MYEINVSLHGSHYFATAPRSLPDSGKASIMVVDFVKRFPAEDGFKISVSYSPGVSYSIRDIQHASIVDIQAAIAGLSKPY